MTTKKSTSGAKSRTSAPLAAVSAKPTEAVKKEDAAIPRSPAKEAVTAKPASPAKAPAASTSKAPAASTSKAPTKTTAKAPAKAPEATKTKLPAAAPAPERTRPPEAAKPAPARQAAKSVEHPHTVANLIVEGEFEQTPDHPFALGPDNAIDAELRQRMISERAYHLYSERGGGEGYDLDDWLQAEAEIDHLLLNPTTP